MSKYRENVEKLLNSKNMKRSALVMERAKRIGKLEIYPRELVKYNNGKMVDGVWREANEEPNEDGTYDVMGISGSDVQSYWDFYWWQPSNWKDLLLSFKNYFENINEFIIDGFWWRFKRNKLDYDYFWLQLKTWGLKHHPFEVKRSGWVWVADSLSQTLESESFELAEDLMAQSFGYADSMDFFEKKKTTIYLSNKDKVFKLQKELLASRKEEVFASFLKRNEYVQVADYMWANSNDPTCFVIDEKITPFDLRDGWSEAGLTAPIAKWVKVFYGLDIPVVYKADEDA